MNACTRRKFIRNAALGGLGFTVLRNSRSAYGFPENGKINLAIIGCGGRGRSFAQLDGCCALGNHPNVRVAFLCDVNEVKAAPAFRDFPDAKKGYDFRAMFDKYHKEFDAVLSATSELTRAAAGSLAIRAGKHFYGEKSLVRLVGEARVLTKLAADSKVMTQMGNQGGFNRRAVNLVWSGALGEVREAHVWNTSGGMGRKPRPPAGVPVPPTLKWDLWLGPAAYREYHPAWMAWVHWRDFGAGTLGMWSTHIMATMYKCLKIGDLWKAKAPSAPHPIIKVSAECDELSFDSTPTWENICWEVPAREGMPPVKIHWYNGDRPYLAEQGRRAFVEDLLGRKIDWGDEGEKQWRDWTGSILIGEKGLLHAVAGDLRAVLPKEKFDGIEPPNLLPPGIGSPGITGWIDAIAKGGVKPMSCIDEFSGPYAEFYLLGNVATLFAGETLEYDPIDCRIVNNSLADDALRPHYRQGWSL